MVFFPDLFIHHKVLFIQHEHIIQEVKIVSQNTILIKLDDIIHIIASHHNLKEWSSPVKPNSIEAWIIHYADNISGRLLNIFIG